MKRDMWSSRLGFIFAVAGSAIGLANIWRFPYVVGNHGGAAFIAVYLICLLAIGFPVFMAEILIGRKTQLDPSGAFQMIGKKPFWGLAGKLTILTGFIVSSFYSAVAGWIVGYFFEALKGNLNRFENNAEAIAHHAALMSNPWWGVGFHALFLIACVSVLYLGVRKGIERYNKFFMPILFIILLILVVKGLFMPNALNSLSFLLKPRWELLTPAALLIALGQSFFTLSVGQGTLVTYGSYLSKDEPIVKSTLPVVIMDTVVSIFAALAVFTIVFSVGMSPDSGPALIFHTLPIVFSQIPGGYFLGVLFFLLVVLAALTSEISALEPTIAYLIDERGWKRHKAVIVSGLGSFLLGVPSALSSNLLKDVSIFGFPSFLDAIMFLCSDLLIPIGGFLAVILTGWVWGNKGALSELERGSDELFKNQVWLRYYFTFSFKFLSPILIIIVFLSALGLIRFD